MLNIVRVTALPDPVVANTIYLLPASSTELQIVTVGNTITDIRSTTLSSDISGNLSAAVTALEGQITAGDAATLAAAATDATTKADAAEAAAIAAAATDATTKANAAQAAAIAAAATDATTKADAAEANAIAAAAADATTKASAAQAAAIAAAATDATTKANAAQTAAQTYADGAIITAIGNLDLTNNAHLVQDITARDALMPTLTKSGFVLVTDATDDATVQLGAALYFFDLVSETFTKVSEYESMDVIIPNMDILEDLSVIEGDLAYNGVKIGTVQQGEHQW